jgi:hypothetical protein
LAEGKFSGADNFGGLGDCYGTDLFTIDSGYLWYNYHFMAGDGTEIYWHTSEVINNNIYITATTGSCIPVHLGVPTHCNNIKLMPCDSFNNTIFVNIVPLDFSVTDPNSFHYSPAHMKFYSIKKDETQTCNQSLSIVSYLEIALGPNDLKLKGSKKDESVLLSWQVSSETQFQQFDILKSEQNGDYYKIGRAQQLQHQEDYFFQDKDFKESAHYKIKAYDFENNLKFSNTVFFKGSSADNISISPNPTNGEISINGLENTEYKLTILSTVGKNVYQKTIVPNQLEQKIDLSSLAQGMYIINLEDVELGKNQTFKLIKN